MLNLNSIMIGTSDAKALADFYEKVFQKPADMKDESGWAGWQVGSTFLNIGPHSEITGQSAEPQRLIFNLETDDVRGEFARMKEFATVIKEAYEMEGWEGGWIATLADPDGNYFQLMSPFETQA